MTGINSNTKTCISKLFAMTTGTAPYRPIESHSRARKTFSQGPQNMFTGPLWGE